MSHRKYSGIEYEHEVEYNEPRLGVHSYHFDLIVNSSEIDKYEPDHRYSSPFWGLLRHQDEKRKKDYSIPPSPSYPGPQKVQIYPTSTPGSQLMVTWIQRPLRLAYLERKHLAKDLERVAKSEPPKLLRRIEVPGKTKTDDVIGGR